MDVARQSLRRAEVSGWTVGEIEVALLLHLLVVKVQWHSTALKPLINTVWFWRYFVLTDELSVSHVSLSKYLGNIFWQKKNCRKTSVCLLFFNNQTVKVKAEARLDLLREVGVAVETWLKSAMNQVMEELENERWNNLNTNDPSLSVSNYQQGSQSRLL